MPRSTGNLLRVGGDLRRARSLNDAPCRRGCHGGRLLSLGHVGRHRVEGRRRADFLGFEVVLREGGML